MATNLFMKKKDIFLETIIVMLINIKDSYWQQSKIIKEAQSFQNTIETL